VEIFIQYCKQSSENLSAQSLIRTWYPRAITNNHMTAWTARTGCNKNNFCNFDLQSSTACSNCITFYQNENRQWHENETLASQQHHPVIRLPQQVLMWRHWFLTSEWNDTLKDAFPLSLQPRHHFVSARRLALQLKPNPW